MIIHKNGWVLRDSDDSIVRDGDVCQDFRGEPHRIEGGSPPLHEGSTGRIWTNKGEYFPGVCNLTWHKESF